MDLQELRIELDKIDREMTALFARRMRVCEDVARYKMTVGKPVLDASRSCSPWPTSCPRICRSTA